MVVMLKKKPTWTWRDGRSICSRETPVGPSQLADGTLSRQHIAHIQNYSIVHSCTQKHTQMHTHLHIHTHSHTHTHIHQQARKSLDDDVLRMVMVMILMMFMVMVTMMLMARKLMVVLSRERR